MPSFDIVSEVDWQEVKNAVAQANREISARFDFKGSDARVEQSGKEGETLTIHADDKYKAGQVLDVLRLKLAKREVDVQCLKVGEAAVSPAGKAVQEITVRHGLDAELARAVVKEIKNAKMKVQASIQGGQVRVSGKKRDDLQAAIALIKDGKWGMPLQYVNFRD